MTNLHLDSPFRGPRSFGDSEADRAFFCGRDEDADQLASQVIVSPLTVLFGRSLLGKTSLIYAGVLHRLRSQRCFPVVTRFTWVSDDEAPTPEMHSGLLTGDITTRLIRQVRLAAADAGVTISGGEDFHDLWSYFSFTRFAKDDQSLRPVLIIDQFEELFSRIAEEPRGKFIEQFAYLVGNRVPEDLRRDAVQKLESPLSGEEKEKYQQLAYGQFGHNAKILIAVRDDFLPEFDRLKDKIPTLYRATARLLPMTDAQARDAIMLPPSQAGKFGGDLFSFANDAVDEIVRFLKTKIVSGKEITDARFEPEPLQLQILCAGLDRQRRKGGKAVISKSDLGGRSGIQRVMSAYYIEATATLRRVKLGGMGWRFHPVHFNWLIVNFPRAAARRLCEMQLITPGGQRNTLPGDMIARTFGVIEDDLRQLVNRSLLRVETRLNAPYYELSHDSFVRPLLEYRTRRTLKRRVGTASALAIGLALISFARGGVVYDIAYANAQDSYFRDILDSQTASSEQRAASIRWIGTQRKLGLDRSPVVLEKNAQLENAQLDNLDLRDARASYSTFSGVKFDGTDLSGADFRHAKIRASSTFNRAVLDSADFSYAEIESVDFTNADLKDAKFDNVVLEDAKFDLAGLEGASFAQARFDSGLSLSGSSWWLASGWDLTAIAELERRFPHAEYEKSDSFKRLHEEKLRDVPTPTGTENDDDERGSPLNNNVEKAFALNELAWWLAICGAQLDGAEVAARDAVRITAGTSDSQDEAYHKDTLAYILMQRRNISEASALMADVIAALGQEGPSEVYLRYAWVLNQMGSTEQADVMLRRAVVDGNYVPTHELVLLPGMLEQYKEFKDRTDARK